MLQLYTIFIRLYGLAIRLAAPFQAKARDWREGRHNWAARLEAGLAPIREANRRLVWIHCASLGEFEQGRPLIEGLKERRPDTAILLTFFSPSGYQVRKNYALADHVAYLPLDTSGNARRFLAVARPDLAIFVKYEFWVHHLRVVKKQGVPLVLVSALFRPGQVFFQPWGRLFRRLLDGFDHIFVQDEPSAELLRGWTITRSSVAGDTRVDRVAALAAQATDYPLVRAFAGNSPVLVAGSTWPPDEERLAPFLNGHLPDGWKVIIAPHQIDEGHLVQVERRLRLPLVRYSQLSSESAPSARILLIDNIGMLAGLYQYGRLAYIGGGFGAGIHNTLEPIAFGLPVLFGPRFRKFREAVHLVEHGGAFVIDDTNDLLTVFRQLEEETAYRKASAHARAYIDDNRGATGMILDYLDSRAEVWKRAGG